MVFELSSPSSDDIILEWPVRSHSLYKTILAKGIDKLSEKWYNSQAVPKRGGEARAKLEPVTGISRQLVSPDNWLDQSTGLPSEWSLKIKQQQDKDEEERQFIKKAKSESGKKSEGTEARKGESLKESDSKRDIENILN